MARFKQSQAQTKAVAETNVSKFTSSPKVSEAPDTNLAGSVIQSGYKFQSKKASDKSLNALQELQSRIAEAAELRKEIEGKYGIQVEDALFHLSKELPAEPNPTVIQLNYALTTLSLMGAAIKTLHGYELEFIDVSDE